MGGIRNNTEPKKNEFQLDPGPFDMAYSVYTHYTFRMHVHAAAVFPVFAVLEGIKNHARCVATFNVACNESVGSHHLAARCMRTGWLTPANARPQYDQMPITHIRTHPVHPKHSIVMRFALPFHTTRASTHTHTMLLVHARTQLPYNERQTDFGPQLVLIMMLPRRWFYDGKVIKIRRPCGRSVGRSLRRSVRCENVHDR